MQIEINTKKIDSNKTEWLIKHANTVCCGECVSVDTNAADVKNDFQYAKEVCSFCSS